MCNIFFRRPQSSCSYLQDGIKSECLQVYNYHRLLTWDQHSGLTMDVFKVINFRNFEPNLEIVKCGYKVPERMKIYEA